MSTRKWLGVLAGLAVFALVAWVPSGLHRVEHLGRRPAYAAAVAALMAVWWLTEALPIGWTALVPAVLFPAFGVFGRGFAGDLLLSLAPFVDAYVFLFMGGMALGAAMEEWQLHRRVALVIMRAIGTDPRRIVLGMIVATAAVSMWISNTATAVMMLPIATALVAQLEASTGRRLEHFGGALVLAVAYGANVGGIGTKIGSPTNSILAGFIAARLHYEVGFLRYMALGLPFVLLFLPVVFAVLWRHARKDALGETRGREWIDHMLREMGAPSRRERTVALVFLAAALLWIAGNPVHRWLEPRLAPFWPGGRFLTKHYEASVAMTAALVLALFGCLSARALRRMSWSTLVLLGGSFAMAAGIEGSGLSRWMALQLSALSTMSEIAQLVLVSFATVGLSAVASNTATVNVLLNVLPASLPVLSASGIAASCDFMLPAGTPPNAIVFGSGRIRLPTMIKTGFVLDVLAALIIALYAWSWIGRVL